MSRRLNRDPLPLHKPEAYSTLLQWPAIARGGHLHSMVPLASMMICSCERDEMVFDLRGHTYCCGSERGSFHQ